VVDDVVAVEGGLDVLLRGDGVHRLGAAGELRHDALAHEGRQRGAARVRLADLDARDPGDSARLDVLQDGPNQRAPFVERQRAVLTAQEGKRDDRRGRDGRDRVDPVHDLEGDLGHRAVLAQPLGQGERLAEPHVGGAEGPALRLGVVDDPAQSLGLLRRAVLLGGHRPHLVQLVVDDRHRHQEDVVHPALAEGLDQVVQDPVARRAQLARPGAAALDVPLEVEALSHEVAEVLAQHRLVDGSVLHAAPDEHVAVAPGDGSDRPEVQVVAAQHVVGRKAVALQHRPQHERVDVRAVAREEHQRV
jgi:hypothetical protein